MIRFYSSSLLTLLILRSTFCLDCITPVKSCPCSEEEWKTRSATYQCTDLSYACMLTFNNTLVEACIYDYQIKPAATGCPTIYSCIDTLPLLTIEEDFTTCPIDKKGCPPADHTGYSLSKLYQFPECTRRTASSPCSTNITIIIEEGQSGSLKVVLGVLVPICILALLVATICYLRKRHLNRRRRANRKIDFEADYIPAPTFDVEFYGKQFLVSSGNFFADIGKCRDWLTRAKNELPGEINSVINYMDKDIGSTPLSEAIFWGKKDVVALLLMEGADFEILNELLTPRNIETGRGHFLLCQFVCTTSEVIKRRHYMTRHSSTALYQHRLKPCTLTTGLHDGPCQNLFLEDRAMTTCASLKLVG